MGRTQTLSRMDQQEQHIGPDVMEVPIPSTLNNMEVEVNVDNLAAPEQEGEPWTLATLLASPAVVDWMGREVFNISLSFTGLDIFLIFLLLLAALEMVRRSNIH